MKKLYMIGNTHFDPVWLWRWEEAMASIRATFRSALDRMNEEPDFIYSFATPPVFEWIRKTDLEMFQEIRQRVREGRWELAEGWWVQPDCYGASGESYVRQGLYGQRYLMEQFGKYSDCVFNIDSFGHSPMLPQILKKSGIDYYCFIRPESKHISLDKPLFRWKSKDGSSVLAYRASGAYKQDWLEPAKKQAAEEDALIVYGVTDHGGAPTKQTLREIKAEEDAVFSTLSGYFKTHDTGYTVTKELLTGDFGPYANYSKIKKMNRIAEYAVLNAEKASLISGTYDSDALTACWKDILFNQFHDILGGACIKDAYIDAENMLGRATATANEILHIQLQAVTRKIQMPGKNPDTAWNLVIWNLNGKPYDGFLEAEVQWAHEFGWYDKGLSLEDAEGNRYPCQIIREKSVIPRFRSRCVFRAQIPAVGYKVFKVVQTGEEVQKKSIDPYVIQTDRLCVTFSKEDGCIESVKDLFTGEMLCGKMLVPVCYGDKGDTWCFNVTGYEDEPHYFRFEGIQTIEAGELMTEIKGTYRLGLSSLEIYYRFFAGTDFFDVRYRANWEEKHAVLKLETPVGENLHTAAVPFGTVERGESTADVPLGAWVKAGNITFCPNSIFAYRMLGQCLGLTVLRSPIYGDLRIDPIDPSVDYDIIDRGIVEGGIRVSFGDVPWETAESFCNLPIVIPECCHDGILPAQQSYYAVQTDGIQLAAIKKCEDDHSEVIRLVETDGNRGAVSFTARGITYQTEIAPFEIKTLRLCDTGLQEINMLEEKER